jgi:thioredoxin 1
MLYSNEVWERSWQEMKILLHFTADWCQPCKKIKPVIDSYILQNPDVQYIRVDVDEDPDTTTEHGVRSIPTLIVLTDREISNRHNGVITYTQLEELITKPL